MTSPDGSPGPATGLAARVARNTGVLAASRFLARGLGMGVTILLARHLGVEGYGIYQRAEAFVLLFGVIANLGLDMILTREVARRPADTGRLFSTVMLSKLLLGGAAYAALWGAALARGYDLSFLLAVQIFGVVLVVNALAQTLDAVMQGRQAMHLLALVTLVGQAVWTVGAVVCVALGGGYLWVIAALGVASVTHLAVAWWIMVRRLRIPWQKPHPGTLVYFVRQALPLAFAASFVVLYQQIDAVMLGDLKGNAEVGWYKAGAKLLQIFAILRESFMLAIFPVLASLVLESRERLGWFLTRAVRYQLILAFYFVVIFSLFARVAPKLLGSEFGETALLLPLLIWIIVPQVVSITCGRALVASENQGRLVLTTGVSLVVNITGNLILIPRHGILGAALASVISESVVALLNVYYVNRLVCPTHLVRASFRPALAALLTAAALYPVSWFPLVVGIPLALVTYVGFLLLLRTFRREEVEQGLEFVRDLMLRRWRSDLVQPRPGASPDIEHGDLDE